MQEGPARIEPALPPPNSAEPKLTTSLHPVPCSGCTHTRYFWHARYVHNNVLVNAICDEVMTKKITYAEAVRRLNTPIGLVFMLDDQLQARGHPLRDDDSVHQVDEITR